MTRSPIMRRSPNGIPAKVISAKNTEKKGARLWRALSALAGTISSFVNIFTTSAMPWNIPSIRKPKMSARFAYHPGVKSRDGQRSEKDYSRQDELDDHHFDHDCRSWAVRGRCKRIRIERIPLIRSHFYTRPYRYPAQPLACQSFRKLILEK